MSRGVRLLSDASGANLAGRTGDVCMVVDVIDMSTTCQSFLDEGALAVFGAAPCDARIPVPVSPHVMGVAAGRRAIEAQSEVIVVSEPRVGPESLRRKRASEAIAGIESTGAPIQTLLPNLGAETPRLCECARRIVIVVSAAGGACFDSAATAGAPVVTTGTVARTLRRRGVAPALNAALRGASLAAAHEARLSIVAASSRALEDLLAAQFIEYLVRLSSPGTR